MRRLLLWAGVPLSLASAAPSEVLYTKRLDFLTHVETRRDLDLGKGLHVRVEASPGEYVYEPRVSFLFQKLRPVLPAPFAKSYILNEVPFRVIGHYRIYAQRVITPSVLTLILPLENTRSGDLHIVYLWDGEQYLNWGQADGRGAFVTLAQFSPRLKTTDFGYGVRIVIAAVSRQALIPVCQRRGGTVGVDGCNASGFPGSP